MVSKYADHLQLYRLERQAARSGVILSRSTLADWSAGPSKASPWNRSGSASRNCASAWCCMPMKPRCSNSIRAGEKINGPICGRIAAMPWEPIHRSSSSTTNPAGRKVRGRVPRQLARCADGR
ncbi:MAG: transposase [Candidatus Accumulibacter sp.]|nr:transposase [Candidatus Accumulibacter propinquus]